MSEAIVRGASLGVKFRENIYALANGFRIPFHRISMHTLPFATI